MGDSGAIYKGIVGSMESTICSFHSESNGYTYTGAWHGHKMHGVGHMEYDGGDSYNGEWVNGHSEGHGVYTFGEGSHYTGQFRAGLSEGYGAYESSDSEFKLGMWINDKEDGPMRFMDLVSGDIRDVECSTAIQLKIPADMTDVLPRVRRGRDDIFQVSLSSYIHSNGAC